MSGSEAEILVSIAVSILSIFLLAISLTAYRKTRRRRLLFVTAAFFVFAVKGFLVVTVETLDIQFLTEALIEPLANLLDLGILLLFFLGLIKE